MAAVPARNRTREIRRILPPVHARLRASSGSWAYGGRCARPALRAVIHPLLTGEEYLFIAQGGRAKTVRSQGADPGIQPRSAAGVFPLYPGSSRFGGFAA